MRPEINATAAHSRLDARGRTSLPRTGMLRETNWRDSSERRPKVVAILRNKIIQVALASKTGGARARHLAQLLQIARMRDGSDDLLARQPLAVTQDVFVLTDHRVLHLNRQTRGRPHRHRQRFASRNLSRPDRRLSTAGRTRH